MESNFCGGCGYELVGLQPMGRCPECGRFYDLHTGRGTVGRRRPWVLRHGRTAAALALAGCVVLCSGVLSLAATNKLGLILTGLLVAGVVLLGAMLSYLDERQDERNASDD